MDKLLAAIIERSRTVLSILAFLMVAGAVSYVDLPKESNPDIAIPFVYVSLSQKGISPEDAERLLVRPMEKELRGIAGVKEMTASASEGHAAVTLEFEAGFDKDKALADVREKVDLVSPELPEEADEPTVNEINFSLFPVLVVGLSGDIPERTLYKLAKDLRDSIEEIRAVLEVDIAGAREDVLEIIVDPKLLETYGLSFAEAMELFKVNHQLVPAGSMDSGAGRIPIKVPGLIEHPEDVLNIPLKIVGDRVVTFKDVAQVYKGYETPEGFARIAGEPAIALEVKKRAGENAIETIDDIRRVVAEEAQFWPENVQISFFQDNSQEIRDMLGDLQNNLISAVVLVMIIVVLSLGVRSAALVGVAIPGSFLAGLFVINIMGLSINVVVLFSLILVVGMLVDGAIIVTEFADRKMSEGMHRRQAYILASQRMALPVIASTATTLAAFMPLLFWPGIVGEFMKYLPITLIATLSASLVMALIFVPTLGTLVGKASQVGDDTIAHLAAGESGSLDELRGHTGFYVRTLRKLLKYPGRIFLIACFTLIAVYSLKIFFGKGVEFFPDVEPARVQLLVRMRGDLSVFEMDAQLKQVEERVLDMPEFATVYSRSGINISDRDTTEDTHGILLLEFVNWQKRRTATEILAEVDQRLADIPGVIIEYKEEEAGPPVGKAISIELSSKFPELIEPELEKLLAKFKTMTALKDIDDSRPVPGIEWKIEIDRENAAKAGASVSSAGNIVQFVTEGVKIGEYRPDDSDEEVDIRLRFPAEYRSLDKLMDLREYSAAGQSALVSFADAYPAPKLSKITRTDGRRSLRIRADVREGFLVDDQVKELQQFIQKEADIDPRVKVEFKGEDQEQREAEAFLSKAFLMALAIMGIILVTQFNSFYDALLVLTAVIFSTVGVFLGLLITQQPFGIIMNGIGVISLAGIVVNNNIVLIDTFQRIKKSGTPVVEAVLRTCAQRLRPVLLTTITTILGLIPMVFKMNIDFIKREVTFGAPSTQWWSQLSTSVAFGLAFATLLTLILTPALLVLGDNMGRFIKEKFIKSSEGNP